MSLFELGLSSERKASHDWIGIEINDDFPEVSTQKVCFNLLSEGVYQENEVNLVLSQNKVLRCLIKV